MKVKELLDKCTVGTGETRNGRGYVYNNVFILDRNDKTKKVWVRPEIYNYVNSREDTIKSDIMEYFKNDVKVVNLYRSRSETNGINELLPLQRMIDDYKKVLFDEYKKSNWEHR